MGAETADWSKFKPGSYAKYKTTTAVATTKMTGDMKMTLLALNGSKATIETEVTTMGQTSKSKADLDLNAKPGTAPAAKGQQPAAVKKGSETLTVAGKSLQCDVYETDSNANGMQMKTRSWVSAQVPGGLVKSVSQTSGAAKSETTMELVDFRN
jgi:hypothetical protein